MSVATSFRVLVVMVALVGATTPRAQAPEAQDRAAAIKASIATNQAALKQYSWIETTQISLKGEVKKQEQKQCTYGADGKVQKTPLPGSGTPQPPAAQGSGGRRGGGLKKKVVENKVEETKEYMDKVAALVQQYVPPDPERLQAAQAAGRLSVQQASGAATLTVKDYVKAQDLLAIGFDAAAKEIRSYKVTSYVEDPKDDGVVLSVSFANLADGTNYPQQVMLDVAAKKIQVKVTNSGYKKAGM